MIKEEVLWLILIMFHHHLARLHRFKCILKWAPTSHASDLMRNIRCRKNWKSHLSTTAVSTLYTLQILGIHHKPAKWSYPQYSTFTHHQGSIDLNTVNTNCPKSKFFLLQQVSQIVEKQMSKTIESPSTPANQTRRHNFWQSASCHQQANTIE